MDMATSNAVYKFLSNYVVSSGAGYINIGRIHIEWGTFLTVVNTGYVVSYNAIYSQLPCVIITPVQYTMTVNISVIYPSVSGFTIDTYWGNPNKPVATGYWLAIGIV